MTIKSKNINSIDKNTKWIYTKYKQYKNLQINDNKNCAACRRRWSWLCFRKDGTTRNEIIPDIWYFHCPEHSRWCNFSILQWLCKMIVGYDKCTMSNGTQARSATFRKSNSKNYKLNKFYYNNAIFSQGNGDIQCISPVESAWRCTKKNKRNRSSIAPLSHMGGQSLIYWRTNQLKATMKSRPFWNCEGLWFILQVL